MRPIYYEVETIHFADGGRLEYQTRAAIEGLPDRRIRIRGRGVEWADGRFDSEIVRIDAQKGPGHACYPACLAADHRYWHGFNPGVTAEAVDGDLILDGPAPLWEWHEVEGAQAWH